MFSRSFLSKYMQVIAGTGTTIMCGTYVTLHTLGLDKYRSFKQLYKDGFEAPIDNHTKSLIQKVFDKANLKPEAEADIKFFACYDQDPNHMGSTNMKTGSLVGLPINFFYTSKNDIEKAKIKTHNTKSIDWDSEIGKKFQDAIVLSDKAKLFVVSRELQYLETYYIYVQMTMMAVSCLASYWAGSATNILLSLRRRAGLAVRVPIYGLFATMGCFLYLSVKDMYQVRSDRKCDEKAAKFGREYLEGGVEYYTKLQQRNIALRELLGDEGKKLYTTFGNAVNTWRLPSMTVSSRKDKMIKLLAELDNKENEIKEEIK